MIIDTSALLAVILGEPDAERFLDDMASADSLIVSADTLTEARDAEAEQISLRDASSAKVEFGAS